MQNNSIKRRVEALENVKGGTNDVRLLGVEELPKDDPDYKTCSSYIVDKCKAACDSETWDNALGTAFVAVTGENPLNKKGIVFIDITDSIAAKIVDILTSRGIAVQL